MIIKKSDRVTIKTPPLVLLIAIVIGSTLASAATPATKPLRFVLYAGMDARDGDTANPTCRSNIISRPGPPGWGGPGFLPNGSSQETLRIVESLREEFLGKCRATSQRHIPDGRFNYQWNDASQESEDRLQLMTRPRFKEDVSVTIN